MLDRNSSKVLLIVALAAAVPGASALAQTLATWTGAGGNMNYSDANNWDIGAVPLNDANNTYNVVINATGTIQFDVDTPSSVTDLTLGANAALNIMPGHSLSVLDDASISGVVTAQNARFIADQPGAAFGGNKARLSADGGAAIAVYGTTYSSTGYTTRLTTHVLFHAADANTLLDLSALTQINAGFNDGRDWEWTYHKIESTNNAHIDLSALQSVIGPVQADDKIIFDIGNGGTIDLSSLQTTSGRGVTFNVDTPSFTLPSLLNAANTTFTVAPSANVPTLNLPSLNTYGGGTISMPAFGKLNAAQLSSFAGNLSLGSSAEANLASLQTFSDGTLTLAVGATLHAPNFVSFLNASVLIQPGQNLNAPAFTAIDNSRIAVTGGETFAVAASTMSSTGLTTRLTTHVLLSAQDANSVLDASSLASLNAGFNDGRDWEYTYHQVRGLSGGRVDLSGLSTITGPVQSDDRLNITMSGGGVVDLSNLRETLGGNVRFDISGVPGGTYALPEFVTARDTSFMVGAGQTLNLSKMDSFSGGTIDVGASGAVAAPALTSFLNGTLTIGQNATFSAPNCVRFVNSALTLGADQNLLSPGFAEIDNSRLGVTGGASLALGATSLSSTGLSGRLTTHMLLSAQDANSLLDASSLTSIDAGFNDGRDWEWTYHQVQALAGGRVDLSGVSTLRGPVQSDDRLNIKMTGGGFVDLRNLRETLGGNIRFDVDGLADPNYVLPEFTTARDTSFNMAGGHALHLPKLETCAGGTTDVGASGRLSAPALTDYAGSLTLREGAEANLPLLTTFSGGTLSLKAGAALNAPALVGFLASSLTLDGSASLNAPTFTDVDNSKIAVTSGAQFAVGAATYSSTALTARLTTHMLFSASDPNSLLDLSSITGLNAGFNDGRNWEYTYHRVQALAGGKIDLSGLSSITGPVQTDDRLEFVADGGSEIDLSALSSISTSGGEVHFRIGGQSKMTFGSLTLSTKTKIQLTDVTSELDVLGSLLLDSTSVLDANGAAKVSIGRDFTFNYSNENLLGLETAIVHMDGNGLQYLEIGGKDNGLPDPNSDVLANFALGQLIIGANTVPTTVQLLEVIDNGNRGPGNEPEALYLNGLGGPDGLRILGGSTLILDNLNVYTTENNAWVHLNSLFGPSEVRIAYDDGWLVLPEPGTLVLLGLGAGALLLRRRARPPHKAG